MDKNFVFKFNAKPSSDSNLILHFKSFKSKISFHQVLKQDFYKYRKLKK